MSSDGAVVGGILWGDDFPGRARKIESSFATAEVEEFLAKWTTPGKPLPIYEAVSFSSDGRLLATTDNADVHLWEVATRKEIRRLEGHRGDVMSVSFSLNGRRLATSSADSTCLIWDIGRVVEADQPLAKPPTTKQIAAWWDDLRSAEPRKAYAAIWRLSEASKEAIPFLSKRVRPVSKEQTNRIAEYVNGPGKRTISSTSKNISTSCGRWVGWLSRPYGGRWRKIQRLKRAAVWSNCSTKFVAAQRPANRCALCEGLRCWNMRLRRKRFICSKA